MQSISDQVYSFTKYKLSGMTSRSESETRAALANLRRGVGRRPGEMPQLYGEFLQDMPEEMYATGSEPSRAEWAVYMALTLYALHQQGKDIKTDNMNQEGHSLGGAAAELVSTAEDRERIWRRFYVVAVSDDMQEMSYHLRGLIQLLRNEGISLDYPRLAKDLYVYQLSEENADRIRLSWGQDFYKKHISENEEENNHEKE